MQRRNFLLGASALLISAPAIVRSTSLMPIRTLTPRTMTLNVNGLGPRNLIVPAEIRYVLRDATNYKWLETLH